MTEPTLLVQLAIPAGIEIAAFTVPNNAKARIQGMTFCNRVTTVSSFRLSFSKLGAPTSTKDFIYYDLPMTGNNTFLSELQFSMDATDVLRVYSATGNVSMTVYGKLT